MRITKKLKAARAGFKQRVIDFITSLGAVEHDGLYRFKLVTPIGEIFVCGKNTCGSPSTEKNSANSQLRWNVGGYVHQFQINHFFCQ